MCTAAGRMRSAVSRPTPRSIMSNPLAGAAIESANNMDKPVIIAVDDDPEVVDAVARDLRLGYGEHYLIVRAGSGQAALEAAPQLRLQNRSVAPFLLRQPMPPMSGLEFPEQAIALVPPTKP